MPTRTTADVEASVEKGISSATIEAATAREEAAQQQRMAPDEVIAYLRSLPSPWNDAGRKDARHRLLPRELDGHVTPCCDISCSNIYEI